MDVTERAVERGWRLPDGFRVQARMLHDDDVTDPRDEGDVYRTDVDEADLSHPTRAFCRYCDEWITELTTDTAAAEAGTWVDAREIDNPAACTASHGGHMPDEPLVVQWWRDDRWSFVTVLVDVVDAAGRVWGTDALGVVESGSFPTVDPATGTVSVQEINPLTDPDHPLPDLIDAALELARDALAAHAAAGPVVERRRPRRS